VQWWPNLYSENAEISTICNVVWPPHTGSAVLYTGLAISRNTA